MILGQQEKPQRGNSASLRCYQGNEIDKLLYTVCVGIPQLNPELGACFLKAGSKEKCALRTI
jgi:hypothetical protein